MATLLTFGSCKDSYHRALAENLADTSFIKPMFKKYMKFLKENKIANDLFHLHCNLETKYEPNYIKARAYVEEHYPIMEKIAKGDHVVTKVVSEMMDIGHRKMDAINMREDLIGFKPSSSERQKLREAINTLCSLEKSMSTLLEISEAKEVVIDYIMNNEPKSDYRLTESPVPNKLLIPLLVDKFRNKYPDLTESDLELVIALAGSNDETKKTALKNIVEKCDQIINRIIADSGTDEETSKKLHAVRKKLHEYEFSTDTFTEDVNKILTLKQSLIAR